MGAVILRRRAGANWIRADVLPHDPRTPCHDHIVRVFAAQDALSTDGGDAAILARAFRLVDGHVFTQKLRLRDGEYAIEEAEVELTAGLAFRGKVDPYTLHVLRRCDGRRPLSDVVDELARQGGADRQRLAAAVADTARRLTALGFLAPSGHDQSTRPGTEA
jgi:hypothetical protein